MSGVVHKVEQGSDSPGGPTIHTEKPEKRSHEDFDIEFVSPETAQAACRVWGLPVDAEGTIEPATPADHKHLWESALGRKVVEAIAKKGGAS